MSSNSNRRQFCWHLNRDFFFKKMSLGKKIHKLWGQKRTKAHNNWDLNLIKFLKSLIYRSRLAERDFWVWCSILFHFFRPKIQFLDHAASLGRNVLSRTSLEIVFLRPISWSLDYELIGKYILKFVVKCRGQIGLPATCGIWQYRFWSFQRRDTKLERFLAKNLL